MKATVFIAPCLLKALVASTGTAHHDTHREDSVYQSSIYLKKWFEEQTKQKSGRVLLTKVKGEGTERKWTQHDALKTGAASKQCWQKAQYFRDRLFSLLFNILHALVCWERHAPVQTGDSNCSNGIEASKQQLQECPIRRLGSYGDLWLPVPSLLLRGCLCKESIHKDVYETKSLLLDTSWYVRRDWPAHSFPCLKPVSSINLF